MPFFDIRVCEARGLPLVGVFKQKPTSYATVTCAGNQFKTSTVQLGTHVPQWEEASRFFCQNPSTDRIEVAIYDAKGLFETLDTCLGTLTINLDSPKFIQGVVDDSWWSFPNSACMEIRLRIMCHDFGRQHDSLEAREQFQQHAPAQLPPQYQSQYVSPPRPPQLPPQQQFINNAVQNSYQYPVAAPINPQEQLQRQSSPTMNMVVPSVENTYHRNNNTGFFGGLFGGNSNSGGASIRNIISNNNNGYSTLPTQDEPVQIAETLHSAPLDYGQVTYSNPPMGYVVGRN